VTEKHLFKRVGKPESTSGQFAEVNSKFEAVLPAWLDASTLELREPAVVSLRPPRIPGGLAPEGVALESILPSYAANDTWDFPSAPAAPASVAPAAPSVAPVAKRPDTLFDELIPRADEEAVHAIQAAVEKLVAERADLLRESELGVVELARIVAERVIARELSLDPRIIQGLVREGLSALSASDRVRVRLGPFFQEVKSEVEAAVRRTGVQVDVDIDASLGLYGCIIETEWGAVDECIEQRLKVMLERLSVFPAPNHPTVKR
jgi:Flagellar assembly protein FliH